MIDKNKYNKEFLEERKFKIKERKINLSNKKLPIPPPEKLIPVVKSQSERQFANLNRQVFDKDKFNETVDTNFTQLLTTPDPVFFDLDLATLKDFWLLYDKFFYDIPKLGDLESHEFLAKTSGEYAGADLIAAEIQALLDEIAELREENLELRQNNATSIVDQITQDPEAFEKAINLASDKNK
tara:strand:- start:278 stop:826 length:549 start_codon:yes stop_codon:yes gene_type:complete